MQRDFVSNNTHATSDTVQLRCRSDAASWQRTYGTKMRCLRSWTGRYKLDSLHGHTAGVRAVKLLPAANLVVTGSHLARLFNWLQQDRIFFGVCTL